MSNREVERRGDAKAVRNTDKPVPAYSRPRLAYVGSVVQTVQSGPWGNRYETYQGSYWSDR